MKKAGVISNLETMDDAAWSCQSKYSCSRGVSAHPAIPPIQIIEMLSPLFYFQISDIYPLYSSGSLY
jgi:hypothetical protein